MKPAKLIVRLEHLNVLLNAHQKIRTAGEIVSEKTQFASIVRMLLKVTSMLVTDAGPALLETKCVGEKFEMMMTDLIQ